MYCRVPWTCEGIPPAEHVFSLFLQQFIGQMRPHPVLSVNLARKGVFHAALGTMLVKEDPRIFMKHPHLVPMSFQRCAFDFSPFVWNDKILLSNSMDATFQSCLDPMLSCAVCALRAVHCEDAPSRKSKVDAGCRGASCKAQEAAGKGWGRGTEGNCPAEAAQAAALKEEESARAASQEAAGRGTSAWALYFEGTNTLLKLFSLVKSVGTYFPVSDSGQQDQCQNPIHVHHDVCVGRLIDVPPAGQATTLCCRAD